MCQKTGVVIEMTEAYQCGMSWLRQREAQVEKIKAIRDTLPQGSNTRWWDDTLSRLEKLKQQEVLEGAD